MICSDLSSDFGGRFEVPLEREWLAVRAHWEVVAVAVVGEVREYEGEKRCPEHGRPVLQDAAVVRAWRGRRGLAGLDEEPVVARHRPHLQRRGAAGDLARLADGEVAGEGAGDAGDQQRQQHAQQGERVEEEGVFRGEEGGEGEEAGGGGGEGEGEEGEEAEGGEEGVAEDAGEGPREAEEAGEASVEDVQEEQALVAVADAVVDVGAVVIHLLDAAAALAAVVCPKWLPK